MFEVETGSWMLDASCRIILHYSSVAVPINTALEIWISEFSFINYQPILFALSVVIFVYSNSLHLFNN
jgi:hypothetical protein